MADNILTSEEQLISILAELVADPKTTDVLRVNIINRLLEESEGTSFFQTMFSEGIGEGPCPCCGLNINWLVPEDNLNSLGFVTSKKYPDKVKTHTSEKDCSLYAESCSKKKLSV